MKVTYLFRSPERGEFSIENVFENIIPEIEHEGYFVERAYMPCGRYNSVGALIKNALFVRCLKTDIIHITGEVYFFALFVPSRKTVLTIHDFVLLENSSGLKYLFYKYFWYYLPIKKAAVTTYISKKTYDDAVRLFPRLNPYPKIIYDAFNVDLFIPYPKKEISKKILVVGTRNNKNVERIIKAVKDSDYQLIIIGKLSEVQEKLLYEYAVNYRNSFSITNDEMYKIYGESDILCFPSLYEGFGMPIIEAQAVGRPVITSNIPPMNEVAGNAAILVNPYNEMSIRDAIDTLLNDEKKYWELVKLGFENIEKFTRNRIAAEYINEYEKMKKEYGHATENKK